jgi:2-polyprenyl-6-methoxyphenol hydroxylase-like FAD-dependent oxidoreductase
MKVAIVGAGYGGLGDAIACHRQGFEVVVFEQAPEFRRACSFIFLLTVQLGDSVGFGPNASRLLLRWGLGEEMHSIASKATYWTVRH